MQRRYDWLDYARFGAALSVLAYHYLFNGVAGGKVTVFDGFAPATSIAQYGYLGVELFFMISGFVIFNSAYGKTPDKFAVGRAVRLFPAFLVCMTLTALVSQVWSGMVMEPVNLVQYLANLTIVPKVFGQPNVDGVYWTLFFEVQFYVAIWLIMMIGQLKNLERIIIVWAILLFIGNVVLTSTTAQGLPLLGGYFTYFASGCLIALIYRHGYQVHTTLALAAMATAAVKFQLAHAQAIVSSKDATLSPVIVGAIIISFYAAFLAFKNKTLSQIKIPFAQTLGGMTYPLYLLHAHLGYMVLNRFAEGHNKWAAVVIVAAIAIALSYCVHIFIEKRYNRFSYNAFDATLGRFVRLASSFVPRRLTEKATSSATSVD